MVVRLWRLAPVEINLVFYYSNKSTTAELDEQRRHKVIEKGRFLSEDISMQ